MTSPRNNGGKGFGKGPVNLYDEAADARLRLHRRVGASKNRGSHRLDKKAQALKGYVVSARAS